MNPDELEQRLRDLPRTDSGRGTSCPDEALLAAYADATLVEAERASLEHHLADCDACLALVALLVRESDTRDPTPVPPDLVARAVSSAIPATPSRRWSPVPAWAAAATVLVMVPLLVYLVQTNGPAPAPTPGNVTRSTRTLAPTQPAFRILAPAAGAVVPGHGFRFRWSAVAGTPYYDVRVVTDTGDIVVEEHVTSTEWQLPAQVVLTPGAEYYVRVDAYPAGEKALGSEHVPFVVAR